MQEQSTSDKRVHKVCEALAWKFDKSLKVFKTETPFHLLFVLYDSIL